MIEQYFVPYDLAVLAKEYGFNEACIGVYHTPSKEWMLIYALRRDDGGYISAPLYDQLLGWFDAQGIFIQPYQKDGEWRVKIRRYTKDTEQMWDHVFMESRRKAMDYAFEFVFITLFK